LLSLRLFFVFPDALHPAGGSMPPARGSAHTIVFFVSHAHKPIITNISNIVCAGPGVATPGAGVRGPQRPLLRLQQPAPTAPYSDTFAYTRRNTRQPTDSNTSRENMLGRQTTYLFPDKLGKAPLSHKQDQHPTGRAAERRRPDAKQTEKRENRHRKVLALFLRRFSFYCARGNSSSVPQASCGNTNMDAANKLRIPESRG